MNDEHCVTFLQWALPQLSMRWPGFRKVRRQVCRRVDRRLAALGLADVGAYRDYLAANPAEWENLDRCCRVTISRFYRDRSVFDALGADVLPALAEAALARGHDIFRVLSCGCASGEEPYTVALLWHHLLRPRFPALALEVTATDIDPVMLRRAAAARYPISSLSGLPEAWQADGFVRHGDRYALTSRARRAVRFRQLDIRTAVPPGPFQAIFCRNLVFTYYDENLQRAVLERLAAALEPGGVLVCGVHERLPDGGDHFTPWDKHTHVPIYRLPAGRTRDRS